MGFYVKVLRTVFWESKFRRLRVSIAGSHTYRIQGYRFPYRVTGFVAIDVDLAVS